jgi:hypothetical protein
MTSETASPITARQPDEGAPVQQDRLLTVRLSEWNAIRDDVLGAIANQHLVLTFGIAAIAAVFAVGSGSQSGGLFLGAAALSIWVVVLWLAEIVRMLRGVAFCREMEALINGLVGTCDPPALFWENWKEQELRRTLRWNYPSVLVMLSLSYSACCALGVVRGGWSATADVLISVAAGILLMLTWLGVVRQMSYWVKEGLGHQLGRLLSSRA